MPFTRQRPDGLHDALRINSNSPYLSLSTVRSIALTAAVCGLTSQSGFAKSSKTTPLTGVWGWTSGSQTYLRARPSAQTPPVAKVARHTKLFVWGKFNGWYRVETTDHVFGWVYFDYISAPDADKLVTLSHKKAVLASNRTAHQTMYGSKELLAGYYERYKAPGAAKGLKKQGIQVGGTRLAKAGKTTPKSSPRVTSTRLAAKPVDSSRKSPSATNSGIKRIPGSDRAFINAQDPAFNDVGNVRIAPSPVVDSDAPRSTPSNANSTGPSASAVSSPSQAPPVANTAADIAAKAARLRQIAANAEAARLERLDAQRRAETQRQTIAARAAQAKHDAATKRLAEQQASKRQAEAQSQAAAKRQADAQRMAAAKQQTAAQKAAAAHNAAHQARLAKSQREKKIREARVAARAAARERRLASRRNALRQRMGQPVMSQPPVSPDMRPISPEELMQARDAYLAQQRRNAPRSEGNVVAVPGPDASFVTPSSWNPDSAPSRNDDLSESSWSEGWDAMPARNAAWDTTAPKWDAPMFLPVVGTADAAAAGAFLPTFPAQSGGKGITVWGNAQVKPKASAKVTVHKTEASTGPKSFNVYFPPQTAKKAAANKVAWSRVAAAPGGATSASGPRGGSPRDRFAGAKASRFGSGLASQALSYRGMPYIHGAASPSRGFDCSGLVYFMLRQRGLNPPRTAAGLASYGHPVSRIDLKPGDLVFFANTYKRGISHIGVYIGNNNFVHAATSRSGVRVDSLDAAYYRRKWYGARRVD